MNNDLISREALREDLRRFFPTEVLEGIEPKTLFAQIMHDIDNAPTVEPKTDILEQIIAEINTSNRGTCDYYIVDRIEEIINKYQKGGAE